MDLYIIWMCIHLAGSVQIVFLNLLLLSIKLFINTLPFNLRSSGLPKVQMVFLPFPKVTVSSKILCSVFQIYKEITKDQSLGYLKKSSLFQW